jgi:hypothetical protein
MDPNATLAQIRELIAAGTKVDLEQAAELMTALDEWLSRGGFLPDAWQH